MLPPLDLTRELFGKPLRPGIHDPKASEDKRDRPPNWHLGPGYYGKGWLRFRDKGADGLYVVNNPNGWVTLRRMGHVDELRERVARVTPYGMVEGPRTALGE